VYHTIVMAPQLHIAKTHLPAGIVALRLTETHHVSPHRVLVDRERAHIALLIQQSFSGLAEISSKAASTVAAFQDLQNTISEGRAYFFGGRAPQDPLPASVRTLRRAIYQLGKTQGFEKILRHVRRNLGDTVEIENTLHPKDEIEGMLLACQQLEAKRLKATHTFSNSIDGCVQKVSKDKHLQNTLCALAGLTDGEKFVQARRNEARRTTKQLFAWNSSSTTAYGAFYHDLSYDGWLVHLAKYRDIFSVTASDTSPIPILLSDALTPEKRRALASAVVDILDGIAALARKHATIPESPIKDILQIHFVLQEMQKDLPAELSQAHRQTLEKLTARVLQHPDCAVYLISLESDSALPDEDKSLILRHFTKAQSLTPAPDISSDEPRYSPEKRTRIRRELRETLENDRAELELQEVLGRIAELKESSAPAHPKRESPIRYHPARLEQEFGEWLSGFQDFVQSSARELLERAARGERVDFKPIPIEKKIFELRLIGGSGIRMYCTRAKSGDLVLLGFGTKNGQSQDIVTARERYRNFSAA
jgi:putative addiction module killer protein